MVVHGGDAESCLLDEGEKAIGVVHLAVAIRHRCEIDACHGEAERRRFKALSVPKGFEDVQSRVGLHGLRGALENAQDFGFGKAV